MTNTSSWQTAAAANNAIKMSITEDHVNPKKANSQEKTYSVENKTARPRRYSLDSNGSGYKGL